MMQRVGIGILSLALLAGLSWALLSLPAMPAGLTAESLARLPESGVTNPVTAVLLNYRGYDTLLEVGVLAWRSLNDRDLFRAVIKFIALGLLIAVAWVRLRAPDVALAEAAVGSGLTGALILSALVRMSRREKVAARSTASHPEAAS